MYFLFVMVQVYLLFPLVLWLLQVTRATTRSSWRLPGAAVRHRVHHHPLAPPPEPVVAPLRGLHPYQFFPMYGAIAAVRPPRCDRLSGHRENARYVGIGLAAALLITGGYAVGTFFDRVDTSDGAPNLYSGPFQPTLLPFLVTAIACLYAAALTWSHRWRTSTPRFARAVAYASKPQLRRLPSSTCWCSTSSSACPATAWTRG